MSNTNTPPPPGFPPPLPPEQPVPSARNRTHLLIIGATAVIVATIIGTGIVVVNSRDDDSGDDKPTVAKATETSPPSSPSSSPTPDNRPELKLGDTAQIEEDLGSFSAAALNYRDEGVKGWPEALNPGEKWAVLDVKVCNTGGDPIQTSTIPWALGYEGGVRVDSAGMNAGDLPKPLYPMDAKVAAGDCVRGNIVFQVPEESRPERVLYSPSVLDEPLEWQIGK
ncbi:DUF4352 domain-containing protein [Streptomyces sp. NPDC006610]|uniref:DUF4352 domain-containing protein n=1 Tax=Streptomyces sp. NPDC006610 TaxID=3154584 RepID=UPI0033A9EE4B